jgi:hypothetical protein
MKRILSLTISAAALTAMSSIAGAQTENYAINDYQMYVTGSDGQRMVTNRETGESSPSNCAPGQYYLTNDNEGVIGPDNPGVIVSCDDDTAMFDQTPPPADFAMDSGESFEQGAMIMTPQPDSRTVD